MPFISAVLLGLGGSLHCVGMCGPLVLRLHHENTGSSIWNTLAYHLSRSLTYGMMGIILGLFGRGLYLLNVQQGLSVIAGIVMLVILFWPSLKVIRVPGLLKNFNKKYYSKFLQLPASIRYPALGMLNALLPCGLVYTALGVSLVSNHHPLHGFLFMFIFGLGTLPVMWALSYLGNNFVSLRIKKIRWVLNSFTFVVALMLILRGLNLGIPYLSPQINSEKQTVEACCQH